MTDLRQSSFFAQYLTSIGWKVVVIDKVFVYVKPLFGIAFVKIQRPSKNVSLEKVKRALGNWKLCFITVEPLDEKQVIFFKLEGFKKSSSFSLPTKTLTINLEMSEKNILLKMHYKTRYNIKQAQKKGVLISHSKDIHSFARNWQKHASERGFLLSQEKIVHALFTAFGNNAYIFRAEKNNQILAELLILICDATAYYYYAYSTQEGKKCFTPTLLTWEAIRFAKEKNCTVFDFDGIYDARFPLERWKGFTRFKKGFGGNELSYPCPLGKFVVNISNYF